MRVLYVSERPPYPFFLGGAARCAHELLRRLSANEHIECLAIGSSGFAHPPWEYPSPESFDELGIKGIHDDNGFRIIDCGYPVRLIDEFPSGIEPVIGSFRPDVIWTQMEGAEAVARMAQKQGVPCLYFVHDAELPVRDLRQLAAQGCDFVSSSRFLAEKSRPVVHRDVAVVHPCPRTDFGVSADPDGYLTMVNPHKVKGVETFYALAEAFPQERFLLLESWKLDEQGLAEVARRIADLPNVVFRRRVADMSEIYAQTRLLLVPSVWEEGFGMVAVEAQSCGIPVIASRRGGLVEAVGDGGVLVDDYRDPEAWRSVLSQVLGDANHYRTLAERARNHALSSAFSCESSAERLLEVMKALQSGGRPRRTLRDRLEELVEPLRFYERG